MGFKNGMVYLTALNVIWVACVFCVVFVCSFFMNCILTVLVLILSFNGVNCLGSF